MKLISITVLSLIIGLYSFGQSIDKIQLPTIIPASPEVSQLSKVGNVSAGMHTGSANVNIPLYSFSAGRAKLDLMLNYNTNGIKVDEIPSRVGLGWSLVAGGVISRVIHDDPDGQAQFRPTPANLASKDQALYDYLTIVTENPDNWDTEWDEYSYSFNGMSGKFFLDESGAGKCFPHTTLEIQATGFQYLSNSMSFVIKTPDGVRYFFGQTYKEKTQNIQVSGGQGGSVSKQAAYETAWFVEKILSPDGEYINFNYAPVPITSTLGPFQTQIKPIDQSHSCGFGCATTYSDQKGVNQVIYDTYYPTSIVSSNGISVFLSYNNRPDFSGDNMLNQISISATVGGVSSGTLKKYQFEYYVPVNENASLNKRFFLTKIKTYNTVSTDDSNPANWLEHRFDYYKTEQMARRLTYRQDWFGYDNGYTSNINHFAPYIPAIDGQVINSGPSFGAVRSPEASGEAEYRQRGALTKVYYPTGGTEEFFYEPHTKYFNGFNRDAGGMRVRKIAAFDPVTNKTNNKFYTYTSLADLTKSSGVGSFETPNYVRYKTGTLICIGTPQAHIAVCDGYMISASSLAPYPSYGGSHIAYATVLESDDSTFSNGLVEHFFRTEPPAGNAEFKCCDFDMSQSLNFPANTYTVVDGTETKTNYYKRQLNNSLVVIKEVTNVIDVGAGIYNTKSNYLVRKRWRQNFITTPPQPVEFDGYDIIEYKYIGQWIKQYSQTIKEYDENGQNPRITTTEFAYDNLAHLQPTQTTTSLSDGTTQIVKTKYPHDFAVASPANVYQKMVTWNDINQVVETKMFKGVKELTTIVNKQKIWYEDGVLDGKIVVSPEIVTSKKSSTGPEENRIRYHSVDQMGNVLEVSKENGMRISYIYDYDENLPIAEIKNASITSEHIAYTSFEADGKGSWTFAGPSQFDNTAPTGEHCYSLSGGIISRNLDASKSYILTYWIKNGSGSVAATGVQSTKQLTVKRGWTAYEAKVSGLNTITISGSALIDELRLHPAGSLMTTYTFKPFIGISSSASVNSMLTRYEYDGYQRLNLVKDGDGNILKQYQYEYQQSFTPCVNAIAAWTATGVERCRQVGNNNNYDGNREKEEKDLNNCSPTYLQTRWVLIGTNGCSPTNCGGEGYRIPTGGSSCVAGQKIFIYQTFENNTWTCKYYYYWPQDGFTSGFYISTNPTVCEVD